MNKKELDKMWNLATCPDPETLDGEYRVDIISGLGYLPARFVRSWTKTIFTPEEQDEGDKITQGWNCIEQKKTGYFIVYVNFEKKWIELFYDAPPNTKMWRRLKDYVRQIDDKTLIGKIYIKIWEKYRFVGYFTLKRKTFDFVTYIFCNYCGVL